MAIDNTQSYIPEVVDGITISAPPDDELPKTQIEYLEAQLDKMHLELNNLKQLLTAIFEVHNTGK